MKVNSMFKAAYPSVLALAVPLLALPFGASATLPQANVPTYSKDVAPIVQRNCQVCHRPGEAGPFSLLTYDDVRRRASKIRDAVAEREMPPWFADPEYGKFSNAMGLSASERDVIVKWI